MSRSKQDGARQRPLKGREMHYTYEADISYTEEDKCWYVDFPDFNGEAYTDGSTLEEAVQNAAEVLSLTLCAYLDEGRALPAATFHNPPLSIVSVEVNDADIALSKCMTITDAAEELGVTPGRVSQLLTSGRLEAFEYGGKRMVTIASVNERKNNKPAPHRPRLKVIAGGASEGLMEG